MGIVKHFGKFLPSLVASLGSEARRKLKLLSSRHELPVFLTLHFSFASQDPQSRSAKRRTSRRLLQSGEQSLGDVSKRVSPSETKEGGHANMTKESSESSRPKASTHAEGEERLGALRIHLADLLIEDSNDHEAARTFLQKRICLLFPHLRRFAAVQASIKKARRKHVADKYHSSNSTSRPSLCLTHLERSVKERSKCRLRANPSNHQLTQSTTHLDTKTLQTSKKKKKTAQLVDRHQLWKRPTNEPNKESNGQPTRKPTNH